MRLAFQAVRRIVLERIGLQEHIRVIERLAFASRTSASARWTPSRKDTTSGRIRTASFRSSSTEGGGGANRRSFLELELVDFLASEIHERSQVELGLAVGRFGVQLRAGRFGAGS